MADAFWTCERGLAIFKAIGPVGWLDGADRRSLVTQDNPGLLWHWQVNEIFQGYWQFRNSLDDHTAACILRDHIRRWLRERNVSIFDAVREFDPWFICNGYKDKNRVWFAWSVQSLDEDDALAQAVERRLAELNSVQAHATAEAIVAEQTIAGLRDLLAQCASALRTLIQGEPHPDSLIDRATRAALGKDGGQ